jgi:hypothetical protein
VSPSGVAFSTVKPLGIKDESWKVWRMLLIPLPNQRERISQRHQK